MVALSWLIENAQYFEMFSFVLIFWEKKGDNLEEEYVCVLCKFFLHEESSTAKDECSETCSSNLTYYTLTGG